MDNCLASNSETGGVGCDNMTMIIIGLLYGKSKAEWYDMIGKRVADGDGPCAPPEYGKFSSHPWNQFSSNRFLAEFRGPGVRHQFDHDSPDEYELDMDSRSRNFTRSSGRIILLGDGTEVLTDSDDVDMFDRTDEDKDTANQVQKTTNVSTEDDPSRGEREGTPGPQAPIDKSPLTESPSSTHTETSQGPDATIKGLSDRGGKKTT